MYTIFQLWYGEGMRIELTLQASFIGLGQMGFPMASNLWKGGVDLAVYNRSREKAEPLVKAGAKRLNSLGEAFKHAPIALSMVANDQALMEVSEGLLAGAAPGCLHISLSTVDPATTQKLAKLHLEKGVSFVAAPVFGRPDAAARQELWICTAGEEMAKKRAEPYLSKLGRNIYDFGDKPESANTVKLAGNFMILSVIEMWSEAFSLAEKSGIDADRLLFFFSDTLFPSPVFENYGKRIIEQSFTPAGFKMPLGLKDISLFLKEAKEHALTTPLAALLQKQLQLSLEKGREELDWSAISLLAKE